MTVEIAVAVGYFRASKDLVGAAVARFISEIWSNPKTKKMQSRSQCHASTAISSIDWETGTIGWRCVDINDYQCLFKWLIWLWFRIFYVLVQGNWAILKVAMAVKMMVHGGVWDGPAGVRFRKKLWVGAARVRGEGVCMILFMGFAAISAGSLPWSVSAFVFWVLSVYFWIYGFM